MNRRDLKIIVYVMLFCAFGSVQATSFHFILDSINNKTNQTLSMRYAKDKRTTIVPGNQTLNLKIPLYFPPTDNMNLVLAQGGLEFEDKAKHNRFIDVSLDIYPVIRSIAELRLNALYPGYQSEIDSKILFRSQGAQVENYHLSLVLDGQFLEKSSIEKFTKQTN
ncbi:hypothetical protein Noda2021_08310 [Candidatus Dependentiae bacterium Noda2021]|nr:hypothetical protein Noda2021_08310 [Candidatus Dependentiae bacterium Noda2021]